MDDDDSVWPPDDVRNYAYEGGGSSAGSLSSINSGTGTLVIVQLYGTTAGMGRVWVARNMIFNRVSSLA